MTRKLIEELLAQLVCNTTNMEKGMSKSIQKLCARENKDTITAARAYLAQPEQSEPVHQFRKWGCSDWYDGVADHADGHGPYEERTLYAAPQPSNRVHETDIYEFAGWLTTRKGVMEVGSSKEACPMAEAVGEYLKKFPEKFAQQPDELTDEQVRAAVDLWSFNSNRYGNRMSDFERMRKSINAAQKGRI